MSGLKYQGASIKYLSIILGIGTLVQGLVLYQYGDGAVDIPLFKYNFNLIHDPGLWAIAFAVIGVAIIISFVADHAWWWKTFHSAGMFVYISWGVPMMIAALIDHEVTTGYPVTCLMSGAAHALCAFAPRSR